MDVDEDYIVTTKEVMLATKDTDPTTLAIAHESFVKVNTQSVTSIMKEATCLRKIEDVLED